MCSRLLSPSLCLAALLAVGCGSAPPAASLSLAIEQYDAGDYQAGYETASEVMRRRSGPERDRAVYMAGLCAYRLDDLDEAELRLRLADDSSDAQTQGNAQAMLGLVRMQQGHPEEASRLLEDAAATLEGDDGAQAARYSKVAAGRAPVSARGSAGGFTLQAGAFRQRDRAGAAASSLERLAARHGLGPVRIVPDHERLRGTLYLVQVGHFPTRGEAARARQSLGRREYIVATCTAALGRP